MAITGYYIIGFEGQDRERIKSELKFLASLRLDTTQINIITPLPGTPNARDIEERFGIFDRDWHHYDGHHLVWNHPKVGPDEMRGLVDYGLRLAHPNTGVLRTWLKTLRAFGGSYAGGLRFYKDSILRANLLPYDAVNAMAGPAKYAEFRNFWFSRQEPLWFRDFFGNGSGNGSGQPSGHSVRSEGYLESRSRLSSANRPGM